MNKEIKPNNKPAYIELVLMWMVIFIGFVWMLFFVIDYATAMRIKDSMDDMSKYGAKYVARSTTQASMSSDATLVTNLNNIKIGKINNADVNTDLNCVIATTSPNNTNSQSIFVVQGTYDISSRIASNNFVSTTVVFNEASQAQITCTLNITFN